MELVKELMMLEVIQVVRDTTSKEEEVLATVAHMLRNGLVRLGRDTVTSRHALVVPALEAV